VKLPLDLIITP